MRMSLKSNAVATNMANKPHWNTSHDGVSSATRDSCSQVADHAATVSASPVLRARIAAHFTAIISSASLLHRLPAELRLMIYELVVTPDVVEAHVTKNRLPNFLQINREFSEEFAGYYYSDEVFNIELHRGTPRTWKRINDPAIIRAMFEVWECGSINVQLTNIQMFKAAVERLSHVKPIESLTLGVLSWIGGPETQGVVCSYRQEARNRTPTSRADGLRRRRQLWREAEANVCRVSSAKTQEGGPG